MKLNPSLYPPKAISSAIADFIHEVDLFRRKTDLTEKTANFVSKLAVFSGAGGRGRTDTVLPPRDFESRTSANSITPANIWSLKATNI